MHLYLSKDFLCPYLLPISYCSKSKQKSLFNQKIKAVRDQKIEVRRPVPIIRTLCISVRVTNRRLAADRTFSWSSSKGDATFSYLLLCFSVDGLRKDDSYSQIASHHAETVVKFPKTTVWMFQYYIFFVMICGCYDQLESSFFSQVFNACAAYYPSDFRTTGGSCW